MFFQQDRTEARVRLAFGPRLASVYHLDALEGLPVQAGFKLALRMLELHQSGDLLLPLLRAELEYLYQGSLTQDHGLLALIAAGSAAYARWDYLLTPVAARLDQLSCVPLGQRFEALSGSRLWLASLPEHSPHLRAGLVELYSSAAALGWDAVTRLQALSVPAVLALQYAFQALALDGLAYGLNQHAGAPDLLKKAMTAALREYGNGVADRLWLQLLMETAGLHLPPLYNTLASHMTAHALPSFRMLRDEEDPSRLQAINELIKALVAEAGALGRRAANRTQADWTADLLNEPLVALRF